MYDRIILLIPAYAPGGTLPDLVGRAYRAGLETVVVDDGSGPEFSAVFAACTPYARVLAHPHNCGKGRALKTGLGYIRECYRGDYIVVTADADGQHRLEDARRTAQEARLHPEALVLGSRTLGRSAPCRSRLGGAASRLGYQVCTGLRLQDTQTGLRAFSIGLVGWLTGIPGERYEYEMNMLLACARDRVPIREVEIETVYLDGNRASHFRPLRDSCRVYGELVKFALSSFASFLADYGLYSLFCLLLAGWGTLGLCCANAAARIFSASLNFTLNRQLVFCSRERLGAAAARYSLLAAVVLAGNTLLLGLLVTRLGINRFAAKLAVEAIFFFFSWMMQHFVVFPRRAAQR